MEVAKFVVGAREFRQGAKHKAISKVSKRATIELWRKPGERTQRLRRQPWIDSYSSLNLENAIRARNDLFGKFRLSLKTTDMDCQMSEPFVLGPVGPPSQPPVSCGLLFLHE